MTIKITDYMIQKGLKTEDMQIPDCEIDPEKIKVIMISEVPPKNPGDGFYSAAAESDYMKTALGLFAAAGVQVGNMRDILNMGIYITTAVKSPKTGYTVDPTVIETQLPILEAELALFPNLKVIMLMGDVAKKAVNMITKARTKKNVIPSGATGRLINRRSSSDSILQAERRVLYQLPVRRSDPVAHRWRLQGTGHERRHLSRRR
jgi:uracil-DNA glycosylase